MKPEFFQVISPVVLWLHLQLSFFHYLIVTVGYLLPWNDIHSSSKFINNNIPQYEAPVSDGVSKQKRV